MGICKNVAVTVLMVGLLATTAFASGKVNTWGRVDITGLSPRIKLDMVRSETSKQVNFLRQTWRKNLAPYCLSSHIFFTEDVWRHIRLTIMPGASGEINVMFLGAYRPKAQEEEFGSPWYQYTNIKINGNEVNLEDDTNWKFKGGSKFINAVGPNGENVKCVLGKVHSNAVYRAPAIKNTKMVIEFDVKLNKIAK